jgi:hypothetical protein
LGHTYPKQGSSKASGFATQVSKVTNKAANTSVQTTLRRIPLVAVENMDKGEDLKGNLKGVPAIWFQIYNQTRGRMSTFKH